jgi:parallel beta-helix repeat protein
MFNSSQAATYYVNSSSLGSDQNNGTSPTTPWKTLQKVSENWLNPGDKVLFNCGSIWHEKLTINRAGTAAAPIIFSQYGSGCELVPPTILGGNFISGEVWTRSSSINPIYYTDNITTPVHQLLLKSTSASLGWLPYAQHPNVGHDTNKLTSAYFASITDGSEAAYIKTGSELIIPQGANLDNATIHIRTNEYMIEDTKISNFDQINSKLSFTNPLVGKPNKGFGYFFDGKLWMLDKEGEWFYDTIAKRLYLWPVGGAQPTNGQVFAGVRDIGIQVDPAASYNTIDGLKIVGAVTGIDAKGNTGITIKNCEFEYSGSVDSVADTWGWLPSGGTPAINIRGATAAKINNNRIIKSIYMGINASNANGISIFNNFIQDTGVVGSPRRSTGAIFADSWINSSKQNPFGTDNITNNRIENSGYIGIRFSRKTNVTNNTVISSCMVLEDCGALYGYHDLNPTPTWASPRPMESVVANNIVDGVFGNANGRSNTTPTLAGIYLDDYSNGVAIQNNFVQKSSSGILLHNSFSNTVISNTLHRISNEGIYITENGVPGQSQLVKDNQVNTNIFSLNKNALTANLNSEYRTNTNSFATFINNRYSGLYDLPFVTEPPTFPPTIFQYVGMNSYSTILNGSDLLVNGNFENGLAGWWHENSPDGVTNLVVVDGCASGGKCVRMTTGNNNVDAYALVSGNQFTIDNNLSYRLKFDVRSPTGGQNITVDVRNGNTSPYQILGLSKSIVVDPTWRHYELFFAGTETLTNSGYIYFFVKGVGRQIEVDNVKLEPATQMSGETLDDTLAITNASPDQQYKDCPLNDTVMCTQFIDMETGSNISWPLMMQSYSSKILIWKNDPLIDTDVDGVIDSIDQCPMSGRSHGVGVDEKGCPFFLSQYFSYNENTNGGNLTSISQVNAFINGRTPSATFTATKISYGGDKPFYNNLGSGANLQAFLGGDAASLNADPSDSTDAIIRINGAIELAAGTYNFKVRGDDGYQIKLDGSIVAAVNANQPPTGTTHPSFTVTSGRHIIEVLYWDQGGQAVLNVEISSNGGVSYTPVTLQP